jgi:hypothetical protein
MTVISDIGEGITIVAFSKAYTSDYGDDTVTGSSVYAVTAIFNPISTDDQLLKSGIVQIGDARGYFSPSDESKLVPGNIIERRSLQYEITGEPLVYSIGGTVNHIEVILKRFNKP